ncbi:MAG TPA: DUF4872 domain-containing protein [candidate division Zixibacteria bacterium]|nr:DUF4872 domain-containing protein [candidate division Zixibacteria bacterium]
MILESYQMIGGVHPETASIRNIFAYYGLKAPHTGETFSEPMLLGIGGGLGACYILWEFEKHGFPSIVLAFRNKSNYPVKFLDNLCSRLGATTQVFETAGKKKAAEQLEQVLATGDPAIVWLDLGGAPYYMHYLSIGVVVVYGIDGENVLIDSRSRKPYAISPDLIVEARAKVPSFKNRIMVVEPTGSFDLEVAIREGLQDCVDYLGSTSTSFALPSIRKWARLMTDIKNQKGWPTVFHDGRGLYGTLRTVYEAIEHIGTGGGGLRGMYADFLDEAAPILDNSDLKSTATKYRALHDQWRVLANAALPDHIDVFKTTKELLDRQAAIILDQGSDGLEEIKPLNNALHELKSELNPSFPLSDSETSVLLADIQSHLHGIYLAEKEALAALQIAVDQPS